MAYNLGERLRARWLAQGMIVRPGATLAEIASFEARHSVLLPQDLRSFLQVVNGIGRYTDMDDGLFCFWSIEEFTSLNEEFPDATSFEEPAAYFLFADHSLNCPAYAIRLSNDGATGSSILSIYSDNREYSSLPNSDSFSAFVEEYYETFFKYGVNI